MINHRKVGFLKLAILLYLTASIHQTVVSVSAQQLQQPTDSKIATSSADTDLPVPIAPPASATLNLTVSPAVLNIETDPGTPLTTEIKLLNNGSTTEWIEFDIVTFEADATGSRPRLRNFQPQDVFSDWLKPSQKVISLEPGQWKTVPITFSPANNAGLGYYYAIVARRAIDPDINEVTEVTGAPAILVLARVDVPTIQQELQLLEFSTDQKVYEFLPSTFRVRVENTGNIHLAPLGNIFIDHGDKKDVGILSINRENGLVLPSSDREFVVEWHDGFPRFQTRDEFGQLIDKKKLWWDFSTADTFRFGKYTANLLLVYDNGTRDIPIESTVSFWVIPWRFLLAVLAVVLLLAIGVWAVVKSVATKAKSR
ncbi:MAG: hypothetical protein WAU07_03355 [Microgenomates group bacterium]